MTPSKREKIEYEEGFKSRMYKCPAGKWTIGAGINLEVTDMPKEVADLWMKIIVDKLEDRLCEHDWYVNLSHARQTVIIDMAYQMGVRGLLGFKNMINSIVAGDYDMAAHHMLDSAYSIQTPARANRNAMAMRNGEL